MGISYSDYRNAIPLTRYLRPEPYQTEAEMNAACGELLKYYTREKGLIAAYSTSYKYKRDLIRKYMNSRPASPVPLNITITQDRLFWTETLQRGIVDVNAMEERKYNISLWRGDITRLNADAIVNAANKSLLGCFLPGHNCLDNVIHSFAGVQMRNDCAKIMALQGTEEECGDVKVTRAYNLPSSYVFHTVGPMINREVSETQQAQLRSCYNACLNLAAEMGLTSIAFCCVSTGVFNYPREDAAELAVGAVINWKLRHPDSTLKVIFNTFTEEDTQIYERILGMI